MQDRLERAYYALIDVENAKRKVEQAYEQALDGEEYQYGVTYIGGNTTGDILNGWNTASDISNGWSLPEILNWIKRLCICLLHAGSEKVNSLRLCAAECPHRR